MKNLRTCCVLIILTMLASLLSACDPYSRYYLAVKKVSVVDQQAYLRVSILTSWGPGCCGEDPDHFYIGQDEGKTWQELQSPPDFLPDFTWAPDGDHRSECVPNDPLECYRITGESNVEISTDGGKTWQIDWKMPAGRELFMARQPEMVYLVEVFPDTIPSDLGILEAETGHVVIVAYGNQGVLVKSPSGEWNRYAVMMEPVDRFGMLDEVVPATPLPYRAISFETFLVTLASETSWIFLLAVSWLMLLGLQGWSQLSNKVAEQNRNQMTGQNTFTGLIRVAFVVQLLIFFLIHLGGSPQDYEEITWVFKYICPPLVIVALFVFVGFSSALSNQRDARQVRQLALKWALAFLGLTWLPFGLWALGILPYYSLALISAGLMGLLAVYLGLRTENRLVQRLLSQLPLETQAESAASEDSET